MMHRLLAVGFLWTVTGYLFFPNLILRSLYEHSEPRGGMLLWPAGLLMFGGGVAGLIAIRYPAIGEWFQRRVWFSVALLLLVVGIYVVLSSRG